MEATPSNGSGVRSRSQKATTPPSQPPNGAAAARSDGARVQLSASGGAQSNTLPQFDTYPAIVIEDVRPCLDGGRWPIKRVVGDSVQVSADIFKEGHELLQARVSYRAVDETDW